MVIFFTDGTEYECSICRQAIIVQGTNDLPKSLINSHVKREHPEYEAKRIELVFSWLIT